jgi:hypothetical protein
MNQDYVINETIEKIFNKLGVNFIIESKDGKPIPKKTAKFIKQTFIAGIFHHDVCQQASKKVVDMVK